MRWASSRYERLSPRPGPSMTSKMFGRRHFGWCHFLCRLPLLLAAGLFLMFILYKSTTSNYRHAERNQQFAGQHLHWPTLQEEVTPQTRTNELNAPADQLLIRPTGANHEDNAEDGPQTGPATNDPIERPAGAPTSGSPALSTTRKSPASDYSRQSEIFILIVHEEELVPHRMSVRSSGNLYPTGEIRFGSNEASLNHRLVVPAHIRQLMDILESHRIAYTLDTTRTGLPSELLENPGRYSVIVMDNFNKYTRLNRWIRDQLDRYCRSNQVGVIAFLLDTKDFALSSSLGPTASSQPGSGTITSGHQVSPLTPQQFPISFEPISLDCHNLASANCLMDYQLSDKTQLLRTLKRKPNFIVGGELPSSLGLSTVIAMTSNHVTYEPLTWAKVRRSRAVAKQLRKRRTGCTMAGGEQLAATSQGESRLQKRAVLPVTPEYSAEPNEPEQLLDDTREHGDEGENQADQANQDNERASSETPLSSEAPGEPLARKTLAMLDNGLYDDIKRVLFGVPNGHWLNRLLLLDAIEHLSAGRIMTPLERYIQIDIDDIFVGATGTRLTENDVRALLDTQNQLAKLIENDFKFNLGFSGKYYKHGNATEQLGDELLVRSAHKFTWFCHFWSHRKAHLFNSTQLLSEELRENLKFAHDNKLTLIGHRQPPPLPQESKSTNGRQIAPLPPTYAIAPHHSGVYPIHQQLYEAWRSVLHVQVTSTEEYPHLRPANRRRGFVHETIKVLPRQTCGLYTHTIFRDKYPGGFGKLLASIRGGELFETVLHNPVNIYMTHMSNYANDRLAPLTFVALVKFVQDSTNLRLKYEPSAAPDDEHDRLGPALLADYYFALYPNEREPLWTNPCADKRHLDIWWPLKADLCRTAPKLLIVGPQKTGTTALQSFMLLNPSIGTSAMSRDDFEEVQFFNDKHYFKGTDWYLERFASGAAREQSPPGDIQLYLDKSATYFDDPKAPRRAGSLLPDAHVLILLIDPADRAYSWYQHMKAHGERAANEMTFDQLITFTGDMKSSTLPNETTTASGRPLSEGQAAAARALRNRCLHPGYYSSHLLRWLNYFPPRQIVIIDGEWLRLNPAGVLNRLQTLLRLPLKVDYEQLLVFSESKGFYCQRTQEGAAQGAARRQRGPADKCLGSGKGRKYAPMSETARRYLNGHYMNHNRQLAGLLYEIGQPLPNWLDQSINPLPTSARLL